ncbi:DUF6932 family protein [Azospirillum largimobile]
MPIPPLTNFGVLPPGRHDCTLAEIEATYTGNAHRLALWADFRNFLAWVAPQPAPTYILIDGSFTGDKAAPKDVDVVFDLSDCNEMAKKHWFFVFMTEQDKIKADFRVDFWVYLPGANRDLRGFFEYVRPEEAIKRGMQPGDRKGLLRVVP